jgi:acyl-CoA reductase-like NAD-dependent aldehyde dehydrogenase
MLPADILAALRHQIQIKVGDGLAAGADIGPVSSESQLQQELNCIEIGQGVESIDAQRASLRSTWGASNSTPTMARAKR